MIAWVYFWVMLLVTLVTLWSKFLWSSVKFVKLSLFDIQLKKVRTKSLLNFLDEWFFVSMDIFSCGSVFIIQSSFKLNLSFSIVKGRWWTVVNDEEKHDRKKQVVLVVWNTSYLFFDISHHHGMIFMTWYSWSNYFEKTLSCSLHGCNRARFDFKASDSFRFEIIFLVPSSKEVTVQ